ncbi:MAG: outer membrane protein assembly factor BamB [Pseudomonadota bacterium]
MKKRLWLLAFLGALTASGCGWLAPEEPVQRVSPLEPIDNPLRGELVWSRKLGKDTAGEGVVLRLAVDGGRVFAAQVSGRVTAMDAGSGNLAWEVDTASDLGGGVGAGEGLVLVGTREGEVIALQQSGGAEMWRARVNAEILSAPAVTQGVVAVHTNDGRVVGLDAGSGAEIWSFRRSVPILSLRGNSAPVAAGTDFICGLDGGKLVNLDSATGRPRWESSIAYPSGRTELERVVDLDADPLVAGDNVFVTTYQGQMAVVQLSTGQTGWSRSFSAYNQLGASPNALLATDEVGHLWAIEPPTGETLWTQEALSGRRLSAPVGVGNRVAVGDLEGYLHWLDADSGAIIGRTRIASSPIQAPPVARGDRVFVLGEEGELAAVRAP